MDADADRRQLLVNSKFDNLDDDRATLLHNLNIVLKVVHWRNFIKNLQYKLCFKPTLAAVALTSMSEAAPVTAQGFVFDLDGTLIE